MPHAHTPRPWTLDAGHPCTIKAIYRNRKNPLPFVICEVFGQSSEEAKANARLIAAAPAMLGMLHRAKSALYNVPEVGKRYDQQHSHTHTQACLDIEQLIAQAEGHEGK